MTPEDQGDGLPNMKWRLRVILASLVLGSLVMLAAVTSCLRAVN